MKKISVCRVRGKPCFTRKESVEWNLRRIVLLKGEVFHSGCCTGTIKPHKVPISSRLCSAGRRAFGHERALYGQESNSQTPGSTRAGRDPVLVQTVELPSIFSCQKSPFMDVFTSVYSQIFRDTGVWELHYSCSISYCIDQLLVKITLIALLPCTLLYLSSLSESSEEKDICIPANNWQSGFR